MYSMGLSVPSGIMCDNTAPNPVDEASVSNFNGRFGLYKVSTVSELSSSFKFFQALCSSLPHVHFTPFFLSSSNGAITLDILGMYLR